MAYTQKEKQQALVLLKRNTIQKVSLLTGISRATLSEWSKNDKQKIESMTLSSQVSKVKAYLFKRYKKLQLSNKEAFDEIGIFKNGRELGTALSTERLGSLGISDVARYIVLHT